MPDVDGISEDGLNALDNMPKFSPQYVKELEEKYLEVDLDELIDSYYECAYTEEGTSNCLIVDLLQTLKECRNVH